MTMALGLGSDVVGGTGADEAGAEAGQQRQAGRGGASSVEQARWGCLPAAFRERVTVWNPDGQGRERNK